MIMFLWSVSIASSARYTHYVQVILQELLGSCNYKRCNLVLYMILILGDIFIFVIIFIIHNIYFLHFNIRELLALLERASMRASNSLGVLRP